MHGMSLLASLPAPAERRIALRVTPDAQRALRRGHPWLFDRAIVAQSAAGQPGDLAVIFDERRRFVAIGLYDPASPIRVRILQHGAPAAIDEAFFAGRLAAAAARRASLWAGEDVRLVAGPTGETTGYRWVHGEGDGLPGLVLDRYDQMLALKLYSAAWLPHLRAVLAGLESLNRDAPVAGVVLRLSRAVQRQAAALHGLADGVTLAGTLTANPVLFREHGLLFEADLLHGQKTGFFLDQRANRARVEGLAAGRETLNVFAYTGGFSLYAARGGAPAVLSLDSSAPALAAARRNFDLNRDLPAVAAARHELLVADAFTALAGLAQAGRRFDLVVVDPPAFAKQQAEIPAALKSYQRLAELALAVLRPRGLLVMASCSSRVSADDFFAAVRRGAARAGRLLHEFAHTGHPVDHPIGLPEGAYLKGLYAQADEAAAPSWRDARSGL
jgi:23S rRNA (cytosine1962-C5)-methyltransferase